jgi:hypothetical protein
MPSALIGGELSSGTPERHGPQARKNLNRRCTPIENVDLGLDEISERVGTGSDACGTALVIVAT